MPDTWELIKVVNGGTPEVLATGVCSFDLDESGTVVHTNGYKIHANLAGQKTVLGKFEQVQTVRCL